MVQKSFAHGLLPIWKESGVISKDVSRILQRHYGKLHIGHVGTLDPLAEGILPILIGKATRLQDYLLARPKTYVFKMQFGFTTDTLDITGQRLEETNLPTPSKEAIAAVLPEFIGEISQTPPAASAVKIGGAPLYEYFRRGRMAEVDLNQLSRRVQVFSLSLIECQNGTATLRARCGKGTYVRSLCRDIAARLGHLATISEITREEAAGISQSQSIKVQELLATDPADLSKHLIPCADLELGIPVIKIDHLTDRSRLSAGQRIQMDLRAFPDLSAIRPLVSQTQSDVLLVDQEKQPFGIGFLTRDHLERFAQVQLRRGLT